MPRSTGIGAPTFVDITAARKLQEALRENEKRLRDITGQKEFGVDGRLPRRDSAVRH